MKRKIQFLVVFVFLLLSVVSIPVAFASDRIELDTLAGDKVYYGEEISTLNINSYQEVPVDISKCNLDVPIVEFAFNPEVNGTTSSYTPDFENLIFTFTNQKAEKLTVSLFPRYSRSAEAGEYQIAVNAAGQGQSLSAEWVGNGNPNTLGTYWAGCTAIAFDNMVHGAGVNDKGEAMKGHSDTFRLYYDLNTNALYIDTIQNGSPASSLKAHATDGGNRWCIRDFDFTGYNNNKGFASDFAVVWPGFKATDTVTMAITFDKFIAGKEPSIILTSVAGKSYCENPIIIETPSKGLVNTAYKIPEPKFYHEDSHTEEDFSGVANQQYKVVKKSDTSVVTAWTALTNSSKFTPDTAGDYDITYKINEIEKTITVSVFETLDNTIITTKQVGGIFYTKDKVDLGAVCSNVNQTEIPALTCEIKFNGGTVVPADAVGDSFEYTFENQGEYQVIYKATDYLGRVVSETLNFDVRRYYIIWQDGISFNVLKTQNVPFELPAKQDLKVFDIENNDYTAVNSCTITYMYQGAVVTNFTQEGVYTIKYDLTTLLGYPAKAERYITVYRPEMDSIELDALPENTKLVSGELSDLVVNLKTVVNAEIEIPAGYFGYGVSYVNLVDTDGTATDVTNAYNLGGYVFKPTKGGVYMITARIDDGLYRAVKTLSFDVRTKWLAFSAHEDIEVSIGYTSDELIPQLKDFYGRNVEGANLVVYYGDEKVDTENLVFDKLGKYTVTYSYKAGEEIASGSYAVLVKDMGEPEVVLGEHDKKGRVGKFIKIAEYEGKDDSGIVPSVTVKVTFNGEEVDLFNGGFIATEKGDYVVSYTAVDFAGNTSVKKYTIAVKTYADVIIIASVSSAVVIAGAVVAIVIISKKKNKVKDKGVQND